MYDPLAEEGDVSVFLNDHGVRFSLLIRKSECPDIYDGIMDEIKTCMQK